MSKVIAVGSSNPAKTGAAAAVFGRAYPDAAVVPVTVPSGVSEQPLGVDETRRGAVQRARAALAAVAGAEYGVGLEGGVDPATGELINCCAVASAARVTTAWGIRLPLPPAVVARVLAGEELGPVIDELSGMPASKQKLGAVGFLTDGLLTREQMWQPAIAAALVPHLHPELYPLPEAPPLTRDFTVATFVVDRGRVLLVYHRKLKMWLPPGGHIEPNELPDEAAVREVLEETGVQVELVSAPTMSGYPGPRPLARPEGVQLEDISPGHQHIDLIYFARPVGGVGTALNLSETEAVGWYTPEEYEQLDGMTDEVRAWARLALDHVK